MRDFQDILEGLSDRDLVIAFQSGEDVAYDEIYRRHSRRVSGICVRMLGDSQDAQEAAQEAFLKAYQALARFNGTYQLGAWLARIAANVCLDHLRVRARSAKVVSLPFGDDLLDEAGPPEDVVLGRNPRVDDAIESIQPLHATALKLRALEGLSHKEIAGRLSMTPEQVKALLHRARTSFKRAWNNAQGWALAPVFALRSIGGRSNTSDTGPHLLPVSQSFSPLLAERVAASAVMLVVALSGAPSAPTDASVSERARSQTPRTAAESRPKAADTKTGVRARTRPAVAVDAATPSLLGDVASLPDAATKAAGPTADKPRKHSGGGLPGPGTSQTKPVIKKARDTIEKVTRK
jgi:RNA polymerase sigma-70 factor (ECF subfamily)